MRLEKHRQDQMTPAERIASAEEGKTVDRVITIPFMGELKCYLSGISIRDFWFDAEKIAQAERIAFNRWGYDRIVLGPNTRGIVESLGGTFIYPEDGIPYIESPYITDYGILDRMEPVNVKKNHRIQVFAQAADILSKEAENLVPLEASIGGPFTIASNLRGVEYLLRDCRKKPEEVHRLLEIITQTQMSCIEMAAEYGMGIAMADPVANPALIGPKMYEEFVFPYTKRLTDYTLKKTGKKVSLHMCGNTYSIWKYLVQYELNELSLDNIIDLQRAVEEIGNQIPIAGNVDPVQIVMNGTKEEIDQAVAACIQTGEKAKQGYHLATGCDIPEKTDPAQIDWFMEAVRNYDRDHSINR